MARDAKDLRVTLQAIHCTRVGGDPGDELEIYGSLEARGVLINQDGEPANGFQQVLWSKSKDDDPLIIALETEFSRQYDCSICRVRTRLPVNWRNDT